MNKNKFSSLQDIIKQRQQDQFVGRQEQIDFFERNLTFPYDDPRRSFIFNISGQGGVGKTTLLSRFRELAKQSDHPTAFTDESEIDLPSVMNRFVSQLENCGFSFNQFNDRYLTYRRKLEEIEMSPETPKGLVELFGSTLTKVGVQAAKKTIPGADMALSFVDENELADYVGNWAEFVRKKLTNKDEIRLVLQPTEVLTPLFLEGIRDNTTKQSVLLLFDTYEQTNRTLDLWLREMLNGYYGNVPVNVLFIIAGREELDRNLWAPYESLISRSSLEPFTVEEARQFLIMKGVVEERVVEALLKLSGHLPLLLATLASENPNDPSDLNEPSSTAVERFFKWISDPNQKDIALNAALPRVLDRDAFHLIASADGNVNELFEWLKKRPFVRERSDGWVYHEVVRSQILRYIKRVSARLWTENHQKLANHYANLRNSCGLKGKQGHHNSMWQKHRLNELYHEACANFDNIRQKILEEFVSVLAANKQFAFRWAETMAEAGNDSEDLELQRWGKLLFDGLRKHDYESETEKYINNLSFDNKITLKTEYG